MKVLCANTFAFFGRSLGLKAEPSIGIDGRVLWWWALTPLAAACTVSYWLLLLPPPSNVYPLLLYSLAAGINGFTLVLLNRSSQAGLPSKVHASGRHDAAWNPCPIAAQLVWFALQTGAFVPALLSNLL